MTAVITAELEVLGVSADECLLVTPQGGKFMLATPAPVLREWLETLDGSRSLEEALQSAPDGYDEIAGVLREDGCLREARDGVAERWAYRMGDAEAPSVPLEQVRLAVTGTEGLRENISGLLSQFVAFETVKSDEVTGWAAGVVESGEVPVVLALFDRPAHAQLLALNGTCEAEGIAWLSLRFELGRGLLGPGIWPGRGVDMRDVLERRRTAAVQEDVFDALAGDENSALSRITASELQWMLAQVATRLQRWLMGLMRPELYESELEMNPLYLTTQHHEIIRMPHRPYGDASYTPPAKEVVGRETGIVTRVKPWETRHGIPSKLHTCSVDVARMRRVMELAADPAAFGTSWESAEAAQQAAVGEAIERYCGNYVDPALLVRGSFASLTARGVNALDPALLVLYSEAQHATPGFPFPRFTADSECAWVKGWSHTQQTEVYVPAFMVYVAWHEHPERERHGEPLFAYPNLAGIAAGPSMDYALLSGLEEVIERDASMVWWHNARKLSALPVLPELRELITDRSDELIPRFVHLDNEFGVPVMACLLDSTVNETLVIGFAARDTPLAAAKKALAEAITLQGNAAFMLDAEELAAETAAGALQGHNLKPHRADRRYIDSYRPDFRDVVDLQCQGQLNLDPRARDRIAPWTADLPAGDWASLTQLPARSFDAYRERIAARGLDVISVDVTTPDVSPCGYQVARVLVPGLVPNFPAAFPQLGRGRIQQAAVTLGWRTEPAAEDELNYFPLPHV
ncbi:YcaO-like family protein [Streptomyces sp. NPDC051172]|uniref:YcaO-like family protein n=1 Tax=Streptomyces sp. NPDC051172 TaxID=3155796 RepID=UPI0034216BFC